MSWRELLRLPQEAKARASWGLSVLCLLRDADAGTAGTNAVLGKNQAASPAARSHSQHQKPKRTFTCNEAIKIKFLNSATLPTPNYQQICCIKNPEDSRVCVSLTETGVLHG